MARFCRLLVTLLGCLLFVVNATAQDAVKNTPKDGSVSVTVRDDSGEPIEGASVSVLRWDGDWNETGAETKSDQRGKAELSGLKTDTYLTVRVVAEGFATTMFDVEFSKPETRELALTLSPPARPRVRVLDPEGQPIAGAEIQRLEFVDANKNSVYMTQKTAHALLYDPAPSDDSGQLSLPPVRSKRTSLN